MQVWMPMLTSIRMEMGDDKFTLEEETVSIQRYQDIHSESVTLLHEDCFDFEVIQKYQDSCYYAHVSVVIQK